MANRISWLADETRRLERRIAEMIDESRNARLASGRTQLEVARQLGVSEAWVWRAERTGGSTLTALQLGRLLAASGARLHLAAYPGRYRLRDTPQIRLIQRFVGELNGRWRVEVEAAVGPSGDLRAVDLVLTGDGRVAVDAFSRFRDFQAQVRPSIAKQRDGGFDRLIILAGATHANRAALSEARDLIREAFPVDTRTAMRALRDGRLPAGNAIIFR